MKSPLQLERYFFDDIIVGAVREDVPGDAEHDVKTETKLARNNEDEHRWRLELRIHTDQKEGNPPPRYDLGLRAIGYFRDSFEDLDEDKRARLVSVNGASILYSAAREFVLMITNRCPHGGYWLPTISFFASEPDEGNTEEQKSYSDDSD